MLRLSTKGRYGTRVMLDLAQRYNQGYVFLKDIAKRQEISQRYLEKIISLLKTAGLVKSSRGAYGGYILAKTPSSVTLKEIIQILEGNLSISECIDSPGCCNRVESCMTRDIWKGIKEKISDSLESITLEDILKKNLMKENGKFLTDILSVNQVAN